MTHRQWQYAISDSIHIIFARQCFLLCLLECSADCDGYNEYAGSCYKKYTNSKTYAQAVAHCATDGAYLVEISSQAEQDYVISKHFHFYTQCFWHFRSNSFMWAYWVGHWTSGRIMGIPYWTLCRIFNVKYRSSCWIFNVRSQWARVHLLNVF